jgi:hypothetical protein
MKKVNNNVNNLDNEKSLILEEKIIECLKKQYEKNFRWKSLIHKDIEFTLEDTYVDLVIVKEEEQREKEKKNFEKNESAEEKIIALHNSWEDIRKIKNPIKLDNLFSPIEGEKNKKSPRQIIILGRAGIGKSILCHKIAYDVINNNLWKEKNFKAVFFISLRNLMDDFYQDKKEINTAEVIYQECLDKKIRKKFKLKTENVEQYLEESEDQCLWLLDGYDEISQIFSKNKIISQLLDDFLENHYVIITSRSYAVPDLKAQKNECRVLENIGFTDENVKKYIDKFFYTLFKDKDQDYSNKIESLGNQIKTNYNLRYLSSVPFLLELICTIHLEEDLGKFIDVTGLYEKFLYRLGERYLEKRSAQTLDENQIQKLDQKKVEEYCQLIYDFHSVLAFQGIQNNKTIILFNKGLTNDTFDQFVKEKKLDNKTIFLNDFLEAGFLKNTGNLKKITEQSVYFLHLSIQEYFAAHYLAQALQGENSQYTKDQAFEFIRLNKYVSQYLNIFVFMAGMLKKKEELNDFWEAILAEPRDCIWRSHLPLIMRCFEMCCISEKGSTVSFKKSQDLIKQLIIFLENAIENYVNRKHLIDIWESTLNYTPKLFYLFYQPKIIEILSKEVKIDDREYCDNRSIHLFKLIFDYGVITKKVEEILWEEKIDNYDTEKFLYLLSHAIEIGVIFSEEKIFSLLEWLTVNNPDIYESAISILEAWMSKGNSFSHEIIDKQVLLLENKDRDACFIALIILQHHIDQYNLFSEEHINQILNFLKNEDLNICFAACGVLQAWITKGNFLDEKTIIHTILLFENQYTCIAACRVIQVWIKQGNLLSRIIIEKLPLLKYDDEDGIIDEAVLDVLRAWAKINSFSQEKIDEQISLLTDENWNIRFIILKLLHYCVQENYFILSKGILIERLWSYLKDEDAPVFNTTYGILEVWISQSNLLSDSKEVIEKILSLLGDENYLVDDEGCHKHFGILSVLRKYIERGNFLPKKMFDDKILPLLGYKDECQNVCKAACRVLQAWISNGSKIKEEVIIDQILPLLKDQFSGEVVCDVLQTWINQGNSLSEDVIINEIFPLLKVKDFSIRKAALNLSTILIQKNDRLENFLNNLLKSVYDENQLGEFFFSSIPLFKYVFTRIFSIVDSKEIDFYIRSVINFLCNKKISSVTFDKDKLDIRIEGKQYFESSFVLEKNQIKWLKEKLYEKLEINNWKLIHSIEEEKKTMIKLNRELDNTACYLLSEKLQYLRVLFFKLKDNMLDDKLEADRAYWSFEECFFQLGISEYPSLEECKKEDGVYRLISSLRLKLNQMQLFYFDIAYSVTFICMVGINSVERVPNVDTESDLNKIRNLLENHKSTIIDSEKLNKLILKIEADIKNKKPFNFSTLEFKKELEMQLNSAMMKKDEENNNKRKGSTIEKKEENEEKKKKIDDLEKISKYLDDIKNTLGKYVLFFQKENSLSDKSQTQRKFTCSLLEKLLKNINEQINLYEKNQNDELFIRKIFNQLNYDQNQIEIYVRGLEYSEEISQDDLQTIRSSCKKILESYQNSSKQLYQVFEHQEIGLKESQLKYSQQFIHRFMKTEEPEGKDFLQILNNIGEKMRNTYYSCFISYAWPAHADKGPDYWIQDFLEILRQHLFHAHINAKLDYMNVDKGENIEKYMANLPNENHILLIGTPSLTMKWLKGTNVRFEIETMERQRKVDETNHIFPITPILICGEYSESLPWYANQRSGFDFRSNNYVKNVKNILQSLTRLQKNIYESLWEEFEKQYPEWMSPLDKELVEERQSKEKEEKEKYKVIIKNRQKDMFIRFDKMKKLTDNQNENNVQDKEEENINENFDKNNSSYQRLEILKNRQKDLLESIKKDFTNSKLVEELEKNSQIISKLESETQQKENIKSYKHQVINVSGFENNCGLFALLLGLKIEIKKDRNLLKSIKLSNSIEIDNISEESLKNKDKETEKIGKLLRTALVQAIQSDSDFKKERLINFEGLLNTYIRKKVIDDKIGLPVDVIALQNANVQILDEITNEYKKLGNIKYVNLSKINVEKKREVFEAIQEKLNEINDNNREEIIRKLLISFYKEISLESLTEFYITFKLAWNDINDKDFDESKRLLFKGTFDEFIDTEMVNLLLDKVDDTKDFIDILQHFASLKSTKYQQDGAVDEEKKVEDHSFQEEAITVYAKFMLHAKSEEVYSNYCGYLLNESPMLTADELICLAKAWNINLQIRFSDGKIYSSHSESNENLVQITLCNPSEIHWQLLSNQSDDIQDNSKQGGNDMKNNFVEIKEDNEIKRNEEFYLIENIKNDKKIFKLKGKDNSNSTSHEVILNIEKNKDGSIPNIETLLNIFKEANNTEIYNEEEIELNNQSTYKRKLNQINIIESQNDTNKKKKLNNEIKLSETMKNTVYSDNENKEDIENKNRGNNSKKFQSLKKN